MLLAIKITHNDPAQFNAETQIDAFWKPLLEKSKNKIFNTPQEAQLYFEFNFPDYFRRRIFSHILEIVERGYYEEKKQRQGFLHSLRRLLFRKEKNDTRINAEKLAHHALENVRISVSDIHYGSMTAGINIEPIEGILDFFDNNIEYFKMFLGGYVFDFFEYEIANNSGIKFNVDVDHASVDNTDLHHTSHNNPSKENSMQNTKAESARFAWLISNGTLLVPILLSVYLLYNYQEKLDKIQEHSHQEMQLLLDNQNILMKQYQEQLSIANATQSKIVDKYLEKPCCPQVIKVPTRPAVKSECPCK